jgi:hypothetical protein
VQSTVAAITAFHNACLDVQRDEMQLVVKVLAILHELVLFFTNINTNAKDKCVSFVSKFLKRKVK